jgi:hypothetical protein
MGPTNCKNGTSEIRNPVSIINKALSYFKEAIVITITTILITKHQIE